MDAQPRAPDLATIEERQRKAPSSGTTRSKAPRISPSSLSCAVRPSIRVPVGGCSTWQRGFSRPPLLRRDRRRSCPGFTGGGRKRAAAEDFRIDFRVGDAENLPFPDPSFDFVLSTIGAMFAPDQEKVANELLRVWHLRAGSGDTRVGHRAAFWLTFVLFTLESPAVVKEAITEGGKLPHLPLGLS